MLPHGDAPTGDPVVQVTDENEARRHGVMSYPFDEFRADFPTLTRVESHKLTDRWLRQDQDIEIVKHKFTLRMEQVTLREVIDHLTHEMGTIGITVTHMDRTLPEDRFDVFLTNVNLWGTFDHLRAKILKLNGYKLQYYHTPGGVVFGDMEAVVRWQQKWKETAAEKHMAEAEQHAILRKKFLPDFRKAHVGDVVQNMKAQTGVEVVVSPDVWSAAKSLTWRSKEKVKLGEALSRICRKLEAQYRVKDGRVYIFGQ